MAVSITLVFAKYVKNIGEVKNEFSPTTSVDPEIVEDFDDFVKKDVKINVGVNDGYRVYVRAAIVITWQDEKGTVFFDPPVYNVPEDPTFPNDYELILKLAKGTLMSGDAVWIDGRDGYYYYTAPVDSGKETGVLIESCRQLCPGPNGYTLSVNIIAQTVQAVGTTDNGDFPAWQDAWNKVPKDTGTTDSDTSSVTTAP